MNLVKKLIGKRGSEVVQNVLVLGAMGIIAILVMDSAAWRIPDCIQHSFGSCYKSS